jgi:hypothetical protein
MSAIFLGLTLLAPVLYAIAVKRRSLEVANRKTIVDGR